MKSAGNSIARVARALAVALVLVLWLDGCAISHSSYKPASPDAAPYDCTNRDIVADVYLLDSADCSTKSEGTRSLLGVIEFDDFGEFWNRNQLLDVRQRIFEIVSKEPATFVLFIHGWRHNASENSSNLVDFRRFIKAISKHGSLGVCAMPPCKEKPVIGVYISWRGDPLGLTAAIGLGTAEVAQSDEPFPKSLDWTGPDSAIARSVLKAPQLATVANRKRVARLAASTNATHAILSLLQAIDKGERLRATSGIAGQPAVGPTGTSESDVPNTGPGRTERYLIGHSFGARFLEQAMAQSYLGRKQLISELGLADMFKGARSQVDVWSQRVEDIYEEYQAGSPDVQAAYQRVRVSIDNANKQRQIAHTARTLADLAETRANGARRTADQIRESLILSDSENRAKWYSRSFVSVLQARAAVCAYRARFGKFGAAIENDPDSRELLNCERGYYFCPENSIDERAIKELRDSIEQMYLQLRQLKQSVVEFDANDDKSGADLSRALRKTVKRVEAAVEQQILEPLPKGFGALPDADVRSCKAHIEKRPRSGARAVTDYYYSALRSIVAQLASFSKNTIVLSDGTKTSFQRAVRDTYESPPALAGTSAAAKADAATADQAFDLAKNEEAKERDRAGVKALALAAKAGRIHDEFDGVRAQVRQVENAMRSVLNPPADLVVLLNPATEAIFAQMLINTMCDDDQYRELMTDLGVARPPWLVSVKSDDDSATGFWFSLFANVHAYTAPARAWPRSYDNTVLPGNGDCSYIRAVHQRHIISNTAPNSPIFNSHLLLHDEAQQFADLNDTDKECISRVLADARRGAGHVNGTEAGSTLLLGLADGFHLARNSDYPANCDAIPVRHEGAYYALARYPEYIKPNSQNRSEFSDYWIFTVPGSFIANHNDIFSNGTGRIIGALLGRRAKESECDPNSGDRERPIHCVIQETFLSAKKRIDELEEKISKEELQMQDQMETEG